MVTRTRGLIMAAALVALVFGPLIFGPLILAGRGFAQPTPQSGDQKALVAVEEDWLHARDAATLEHILAPDFVHVIPAEHFLSKQEHIEWFEHHPRPADVKLEFGKMEVRVYGDAAIVNGIVMARDAGGKELRQTAFTDVFIRRAGHWQAVNAQENPISTKQP